MWNNRLLGDQIGTWCLCPSCGKRGMATLVGSTKCGVGGGSLDSKCGGCHAPRSLARSEVLSREGLGRPVCAIAV